MICPHCGEDLLPIEGQRYCPFCGKRLPVADQSLDTEEAKAGGPEDPAEEEGPGTLGPKRYCPWEDQENLGFAVGIGRTLKQSLFHTEEFFWLLPRQGGLLNPLLYALIVKTSGALLSLPWLFWSSNPLLGKLSLSGNTALMACLLVPLLLFLSVVMEALILHLSLFLLGSANKEFEATFRVLCYSTGPELLEVIPVVGGTAGIVWKTYLIVLGLREIHGISTTRSALAVLLPSLICCGLLAASMSFLVGSLGLS